MRYSLAVLCVASFATQPLLASEPAAQTEPPTNVASEEVIVIGEQDRRIYENAVTLDIAPDSTTLLRKAVGANVVSNGPLSGIAQYRGMSRMRISSRINGAVISPGGPNWMDGPLSYAPAAQLDSLEVYRGIAPVSAGLETIGGVVNANTWHGEFSDDGPAVGGRLRSGMQSVNDSRLYSAAVVMADTQHRLNLAGLSESGNDANVAGGEILPTEYERNRFDIGYGLRADRHALQFDYARSNTGNAGTPALAMDIQWIDTDLIGASYDYTSDTYVLSGRVYYSDIDHGMTNYHLRHAPSNPSMFRRNRTDARNLGFFVDIDVNDWTFGIDGHDEVHNSNIDNPNNAMFFVRNFDGAKRRVIGAFAERTLSIHGDWTGELGLRYNRIDMDARNVDATPARIGMPPAVALRDAFNGADRSVSDGNVDWVAKLHYSANDDVALYAGMARKSRSPSYQERYLWLPLQATAGLADGRTYTGNIALDPEVAHEIELGLDWQHRRFNVSPRVFYREVSDYIQGTVSNNASAVMFVRMTNASTGTSNADPLEFNNVDATLYGFDVDWRYAISDRWSLNGLVNYVRGKRDDIDDHLYRVAPLNALLAINYAAPAWGVTLETFLYADQDNVSATNNETTSDGYALLNITGYWQATQRLRLGFGIDNLTNETYRDHLAGVNRVRGNPAIAVGERLPGYERGAFARVDYRL